MIGKHIYKYCCEDISKIENYESALSSNEVWHCHHKLEIDMNLSRKELIENNLYYNRPASELIFLPMSEHIKLHNTGERNGMFDNHVGIGKPGNRLGKPHNEESKRKISQTRIERECNKGKKHYLWHDICPVMLFIDRKINKMNFSSLCEKYKLSAATLYRRLHLFNIN